jgi:DNA polymerase
LEQKSSKNTIFVQNIGTKQNERDFFVQLAMTKRVKNSILYQLNFLKSIGYEYTNSFNINDFAQDQLNLPNDIHALEQIVQNCHLCHLSKYRANVLFGRGDINSNIMFIGDEPSICEDETGEFYAGRTGALLMKMIESVLDVRANEVYITNLVKCKTAHNQVTNEDANACRAYLLKQVELVKPKLIVALGQSSYEYLTNDNTPFAKVRGQIVNHNGLDIISTFHPSFLLRNPTAKKEAYYDMLKIKSLMERM